MTAENDPGGGETETRRTYLGRYASRTAFGEEILRDEWDAEARLVLLPRWLRPYVQLNGAAVAGDLEQDGAYEFVAADDTSDEVMVYQAEGAWRAESPT